MFTIPISFLELLSYGSPTITVSTTNTVTYTYTSVPTETMTNTISSVPTDTMTTTISPVPTDTMTTTSSPVVILDFSNSSFVQTLDINMTSVYNLIFKPDRTEFYYMMNQSPVGVIYQVSYPGLTTINTKTLSGGQNSAFQFVEYNGIGRLYTLRPNNGQLHEYVYNTPWDISSSNSNTHYKYNVHNAVLRIADNKPRSFCFNKDGTKIYFATDNHIIMFDLLASFDFRQDLTSNYNSSSNNIFSGTYTDIDILNSSTMSNANGFTWGPLEDIYDIQFTDAGTFFYVLDHDDPNDGITRFQLTTPYDLTSTILDVKYFAGSGYTNIDGVNNFQRQGMWIPETPVYDSYFYILDNASGLSEYTFPVLPTPTPTMSQTTTSSPVPTETMTTTSSPVPTDTMTNTSSPVPTETMTNTSSPVPTDTMTNTSSPVPSDTMTTTSSPVPTDTMTNTSSPVPTETMTSTSVPTDTMTTTVTLIREATPTPLIGWSLQSGLSPVIDNTKVDYTTNALVTNSITTLSQLQERYKIYNATDVTSSTYWSPSFTSIANFVTLGGRTGLEITTSGKFVVGNHNHPVDTSIVELFDGDDSSNIWSSPIDLHLDSHSFSTWIYVTNYGSNAWQCGEVVGSYASRSRSSIMFTEYNGDKYVTFWYVRSGSPKHMLYRINYIFPLNQWVHVSFTVNNSGSYWTVKGYINGQFVEGIDAGVVTDTHNLNIDSSTQATYAMHDVHELNRGFINIGSRYFNHKSPSNFSFYLGELNFYSNALSDAQVYSVYSPYYPPAPTETMSYTMTTTSTPVSTDTMTTTSSPVPTETMTTT